MSNDTSPNGLVVKPSPMAGFLGGGVSRKLIALIGMGLFAIVLLILFVISQKGQRTTTAADESAPAQQSGNQDNNGLNDILNSAPSGTTVSSPQGKPPVGAGNSSQSSQPDGRQSGNPSDESDASEQARRHQLAREQEAEQLRQYQMQTLQTALNAKSEVNFNLNDAQDTAKGGPPERTQKPEGMIALPGVDAPTEDPNKQDVKQAFAKENRSNTYLMQGRENSLSPYELKVGTLIPATMISGLNSDLPGQIIASVSQNVWDSATGSHLLLPQGSRLYGLYDSQIAYGQDRILVAWTRVNYPDGTTLELKGMGAIDAGGYAGFEDEVDHHYWKIFGNAFILGMITGASEAGISDDNNDDTSTAEAVNNGVTEQFAETGSTLIEKNLDVQPTITIRSGYKFNIMLNKDVVLEPYQPRDD